MNMIHKHHSTSFERDWQARGREYGQLCKLHRLFNGKTVLSHSYESQGNSHLVLVLSVSLVTLRTSLPLAMPCPLFILHNQVTTPPF